MHAPDRPWVRLGDVHLLERRQRDARGRERGGAVELAHGAAILDHLLHADEGEALDGRLLRLELDDLHHASRLWQGAARAPAPAP